MCVSLGFPFEFSRCFLWFRCCWSWMTLSFLSCKAVVVVTIQTRHKWLVVVSMPLVSSSTSSAWFLDRLCRCLLTWTNLCSYFAVILDLSCFQTRERMNLFSSEIKFKTIITSSPVVRKQKMIFSCVFFLRRSHTNFHEIPVRKPEVGPNYR